MRILVHAEMPKQWEKKKNSVPPVKRLFVSAGYGAPIAKWLMLKIIIKSFHILPQNIF